jgi:hypothetical protein
VKSIANGDTSYFRNLMVKGYSLFIIVMKEMMLTEVERRNLG